ncbi:MAG: ABC transporter ATP-binding protein [Firmicutes bacterium]|nr:ABC transporter ATP-binding protein [Candidatus Caballimonas caccae]
MEYAIEINNVTKEFKNCKALNSISLSIEKGEFVTLLGENGAGKSTLIKILCGIISPSFGSAKIYGYDINKEFNKISEIINVSPQETAVSNNLSVKENLEFLCGIYGLTKEQTRSKVDYLIEKIKLEEYKYRKAKTLSGGYQRRLSIALSLINEPKVLFLDEPTLGLDVRARRELWNVIRELKGKTTLILTTHYLEEAEALSDKVYVLDKGEIRAVGTSEELKKETNTKTLEDAFLKIVGAIS